MRTVSTVLGGVALAVAVLSPNIASAANQITNGDFEATTAVVNQWGFSTLSPGDTTLTGWSVTQGTIDIVPSSYWEPSGGGHSIDLTGTPGQGGISQSFVTTPGAVYLLTFDVAPNPEDGMFRESLVDKILDVLVRSNAGHTLGSQRYDLAVGLSRRDAMDWNGQGFVFTAEDALTTLSFTSSGLSLYTGPVLDNVVVDLAPGNEPPQGEITPRSSVPEPASLAIVGLGAVALLKRRRK